MLKNHKKICLREYFDIHCCLKFIIKTYKIFTMKTFKFLSVFVLSLLMSSAFAQQGQGQQQGQRPQRTPEQTIQATVDWMTKDLSLDQATSKKVYDCILKYTRQTTSETQKIRTAGGDRTAITAKRTEINTNRDKELKVILGDSKFELFKKKEAERRAAGRQGRQV